MYHTETYGKDLLTYRLTATPTGTLVNFSDTDIKGITLHYEGSTEVGRIRSPIAHLNRADAVLTSDGLTVELPLGVFAGQNSVRIISPRTTLGIDKVTNGNFSAGGGWTLGSGAEWVQTTVATHVTGNVGALSQDVTAVANEYYLVTFDVGALTTGKYLDWEVGSASGTRITVDGSYSEIVQAVDNHYLIFTPSSTAICTLDNITCKKVTPETCNVSVLAWR